MSTNNTTINAEEEKTSNFLRQIIEQDLANNSYASRRFAGSPGDAAQQADAPLDWAKVRLRFPPEPNGYLHIGHIKSICINFGLAKEYAGVCHLRFDDTNPEKEEQQFVDSIIDSIHWLGFDWKANNTEHLFYASSYFDFMYRAAVYLIEAGHAYVDEQSAEQMRENRGDFTTPGVNSPFRERSVAENLARFSAMKNGELANGTAVLRAKIDMASPNLNMRDPAIYRIRHAEHHRTGNQWQIYPMYTFAHPIEDALEQITQSICTLEFEDQRPFYDWLLARLIEGGLLTAPPPKQYEFARLNVTYVITSKRKLKQLIDSNLVSGWDDPRLPTVAGLRRRGYTAAALRDFIERTGISKAGGWVDYSALETALREDLGEKAPRAMAVIDPVEVVVTNWQEVFGEQPYELCQAPIHPHFPELGNRSFKFSPKFWIESNDFAANPPKGFFRLFPPHTNANGEEKPGSKVRLKYAYIVECIGANYDADGKLTQVQVKVIADTKSGTAGANSVKVKGVITWVSNLDAIPAEIRLYDRLFTDPRPDASGKDFIALLNPNSLTISHGYVEPSLAQSAAEKHYQFERLGYFVTDQVDSKPDALVFNRITGLRDSWNK